MLSIGFVVLLAGYSGVYVGVQRLRGDKRGIIDIWKGVGATTSSSSSSSSGGTSTTPTGPKALGRLGQTVPLNPGSGGTTSGPAGTTPL